MDSFLSPGAARRFVFSVVGLVVAADVLLYRHGIGLSFSLFSLLAFGLVCWNGAARGNGRSTAVIALLLLAALVQGAIRNSFSNGLAIASLLSFAMLQPRLAEARAWLGAPFFAALSWLASPLRVPLFFRGVARAAAPFQRAGLGGGLFRLARVVFPAALAAVPFAILIGHGNAVAGRRFADWFAAINRWCRHLSLPDLGRMLFWAVTGMFAITLLEPCAPPKLVHGWRRPWPRFLLESDLTVARWRSWLLLATLAGVFLWANVLDLRYLWLHAALPIGVTYTQFVHQGVAELSAAAIAGGVLTAFIFQQDKAVADHPATRLLAIACALLLIGFLADAGRRLVLYIEADDLTVQRLSVIAFLALVAAGLGLLGWKIAGDKSLQWLLGANALAVVVLFYVVQFIDFRAIAADYNADRWIEDRQSGRTLDARYLERLGPSAWPALARVSRVDPAYLPYYAAALSRRRDHSWQAWQWQTARLEKELLSK